MAVAGAMATRGKMSGESVSDYRSVVSTNSGKIDPSLYPVRSFLQRSLESTKTEYALGIIILLNLVLIVIETDIDKPDGRTPVWIEFISSCMLIFFSMEVVVRIFTYRQRILRDPFAIADMCVISLDLLFTLLGAFLANMPPVSMMRIIRLLRLTRTTKIIRLIPQLNIIVLSLAGASRPLFWGGVMLVLLLLSWGILAVQLINPIMDDIAKKGGFDGCGRCERAYSTVWFSSLTMIQQVIAGDSWGTVALPVIEHSPWTVIFFMSVFITLSMALMNIILANVVDAVMQARLANDYYLAALKENDRKDATARFLEICKSLDVDGSGNISFDEFSDGFESDMDFRAALTAMDITWDELHTLWGILDEDASGEISYTEFCEQLFKLKSSDSHTVLMFIKAHTTELRRKMTAAMSLMQHDIMGGLQSTLEAVEKVKADDVLLQQIAKQISRCKLPDVDENHFQMESVIRDAPPQESDVSCDPVQLSFVAPQANVNQQGVVCHLNEQQCLAMCSSLELLSKLENKLESNIVALSDLINTAPRTCSMEESSRSGEHRRTPKDGSWLPFVMCCKETPSNHTRLLRETSQAARDTQAGSTLLRVPMDHAKCVTPRVVGSVSKQA